MLVQFSILFFLLCFGQHQGSLLEIFSFWCSWVVKAFRQVQLLYCTTLSQNDSANQLRKAKITITTTLEICTCMQQLPLYSTANCYADSYNTNNSVLFWLLLNRTQYVCDTRAKYVSTYYYYPLYKYLHSFLLVQHLFFKCP